MTIQETTFEEIKKITVGKASWLIPTDSLSYKIQILEWAMEHEYAAKDHDRGILFLDTSGAPFLIIGAQLETRRSLVRLRMQVQRIHEPRDKNLPNLIRTIGPTKTSLSGTWTCSEYVINYQYGYVVEALKLENGVPVDGFCELSMPDMKWMGKTILEHLREL